MKKLEILTDLMKEEEALKNGNLFYREVKVNDQWATQGNNAPIIAYSRIWNDEEVVVIMNVGNEEVETAVTIDSHINPSGSKMKDLLNAKKKNNVETENGRNFITMKIKPQHISIYKTNH